MKWIKGKEIKTTTLKELIELNKTLENDGWEQKGLSFGGVIEMVNEKLGLKGYKTVLKHSDVVRFYVNK